MKIRHTISKLISITMAVAALAVIGSIGTAEAQRVRVFEGSSHYLLGLAPGQTLRCSVGNMIPVEEGSEAVRVQVKLYDTQGNVLAQSEAVALQRGQFRSFDFNRDDLRVAGEPGTGRAQVHAGVGVLRSLDGSNVWFNHVPVSVELIENQTGKTVATFSAFPGFTGGVYVAAGDVND